MGTTWGDGVPVRHRHDEYAAREHAHTDDGTGDYVAHDELEDRLRQFERDLTEDAEREYAARNHDHEEFDDQASELNELRDQVAELTRDRDAMIRRMRRLEEALSLVPGGGLGFVLEAALTSIDEPSVPADRPVIQGLPARCDTCGRLEGMPSAPCRDCPESRR